MVLLLRMIFLVSWTMALLVNGQEDSTTSMKVLYDDGIVLQESFFAPIVSFVNSTENDPKERGNLRQLQTSAGCRATYPTGNTFVCGGNAGGANDPCRNSQATCSGLTYPCTCSGLSETTCSYCQLRGANAILCQQTNSRTTFVDLSGTPMTCTCQYIGNGQVHQNCSVASMGTTPGPIPYPLPTTPPTSVRVPGAPNPTPVIPVTSAPVMPTAPTTQVTCRATNPSNLNLGVSGSCSALPSYPCTCSGSGETSCPYCQVRTYNGILCQVTGSEATVLDYTGAYKTCHCEYRGNGQIQRYCQQVAGAATTMAPVSMRAPSMPVSAPVPVPVPMPGAVPASSPKKTNKKNNKRD